MSVLLWRVALAATLSRPVHIAVHGTGSFLVEQDSILRLSSSICQQALPLLPCLGCYKWCRSERWDAVCFLISASVYFLYEPRNGIAGSCVSPHFVFLRNLRVLNRGRSGCVPRQPPWSSRGTLPFRLLPACCGRSRVTLCRGQASVTFAPRGV